jgi:hypothetical protein
MELYIQELLNWVTLAEIIVTVTELQIYTLSGYSNFDTTFMQCDIASDPQVFFFNEKVKN